jgi:hypothetical protein
MNALTIQHDPFPHAVLDGAFPASAIEEASASWPDPSWDGWHARYDSPQQRKLACDRWELMPAPCRRLLAALLFLDVRAFDLGPLQADTGLWGGGMHMMAFGGVLGVHLDAEAHRLSGLRRKLNAILFLDGWQEEWGGALQLYDATGRHVVRQVQPAAGRLVLFACTRSAYHGVSRLEGPPGRYRRTLAVWWYGPPEQRAGQRTRAHFGAS